MTIPATIAESTDLAVKKSRLVRSPARYLVSAMLAGIYIGVGEILLLSVAGPLEAGHSGAVRLVEGAVFPVALLLVLFAGADLFTSQCMTMTFGVLSRRTRWADLARVWVMSLVGNLVGAVVFALFIGMAGTLKSGPASSLLGSLLATKEAASGGQLFARAVLCNMLVCLAVWMFTRASGDGAKATMVWWPVFAFVASGFEHSIANMALFSLGIVNGQAGVGDLARNLAFTVPGNIVGGAVLVAAAYWFANDGGRTAISKAPIEPSVPAQDTTPRTSAMV
ncbi:formate/nitrite transporter family protein [Streptomyces sp. NBC_00151]|uniref:formate/nitrite transporter family protein n=1 Tax=Streptomyces sp. NBC_00151 TaxID=2975669 RepID=UPI002DD7DBA2|nr:formate/nitrite transporter family protein [Streptomyces sp. NBC_00151]WRZ37872.1 formate/nitrite transporter family protein [Streptomyces sp. NBC_00151]